MSSSTDKPLVYLILGAAGSGRREVVADLIEGGLAETDRALVMLASAEAADGADARLGTVVRWTWADKRIEAERPDGATHIFFLTDGRANPVDQVEALKPWLAEVGAELARVISVVNCRLAEQHPELVAWYDACIHFSDIVLLNRRDGVANKWLSDFRRRYEDLFMPCLFEFVKAGRVKNPALLIEPQARRMSLYFDEEGSLAVLPDEIEYEITDEDGNPVDADEKENAEDDDTGPEVDPYFALDAAGRRAKRIPDVAKFLP
ncbi:hypothetical protein MASR2M8_13970 [Opitutaceae bacterium]